MLHHSLLFLQRKTSICPNSHSLLLCWIFSCFSSRSSLYMNDISSLYIVSISGVLYRVLLNGDYQLICESENTLTLCIVFNKHTTSRLHFPESLAWHDDYILFYFLCINVPLRNLQETKDLGHSIRTTVNSIKMANLDGKKNSWNIIHWTPLALKDIQTNTSITIYYHHKETECLPFGWKIRVKNLTLGAEFG